MRRLRSSRALVRAAVTVAGAAGALALAGCTGDGLSPREVRGQDYATYAFAMQEPSAPPARAAERTPAASGDGTMSTTTSKGLAALAPEASEVAVAPAAPIAAPARIAVAQLGEVAPPAAMLAKLRKDAAAFASVQSIPGLVDVGATVDRRGQPGDASAQEAARDHAERMRRMARSIGADYLFLYGGTVDEARTDSPLKLANATIIGAFIVPGEVLQAQMRAAGSLIDTNTGRVVLAVSADAADRRRAASVAVEGDRIKQLEFLRDKVVLELADQLSTQVKQRAATAAAAVPAPPAQQ